MTKEQVIEDICVTFDSSKKRLIKTWNNLFPEDRLRVDIKIKQELREEMTENIREELEYFDDLDVVAKIYRFCTGNNLEGEDIYNESDLEFEDDSYL